MKGRRRHDMMGATVRPRNPGKPVARTETATAETVQVGGGGDVVAERPHREVIAARERYEILGEHGRGALGRVSHAHDRELGRDVAIKELLSPGPIQEARFQREVQITAQLEHSSIVPVYEAGRWPDGKPFYTMRSISGRPLRELIAERPAERRIGLLHHVIAVADAIAYAHGRHIIHRDLKPDNIIVGEFGETIVIDWGLAKDLTATDEPAGSGEIQIDHDSTLTATGTVLGTPAYMAPEQKRGEHVDERADVFAIGVMLWELCAAQRPPPDEPRVRAAILHEAGIDGDLVAIIDKALEFDLARRYRDAAVLAADLRSFKAGTRIAARQYSLLALLARYTRRHRVLAAAVAALVVVAIVASAIYVRNIAAARELARRSQAATEEALGEMTLRHAQTLLTTDPTAALESLAGYRGADRDRIERIRAEAVGRGVALVRGTPHNDNVLWAEGTADGAVLSIGLDGTIARTARDGRSTVLLRGVSRLIATAYAPANHLLAYACDPSDVCLFDALREARMSAEPALRNVKIASMAFSPDAGSLAVLSKDAALTIVDVTDPAHPRIRDTRRDHPGMTVLFVDDRRVAIETASGVEIVDLTRESAVFAVTGLTSWGALPGAHALALGTADGQGFVVDVAATPPRATAHAQLCHGQLMGMSFLGGEPGNVGYLCQSGLVGTWSAARDVVTRRIQLEGRADLLATDPAGDYLVVSGAHGAVTVVDLQTGLATRYMGQTYRLVTLTPPMPGRPFVIAGDSHGGVRAWPLPQRLASVGAITTLGERFTTAIFDPVSGAIAATTWLPELTIIERSGASQRAATPHVAENLTLAQAPSGRMFVAFGLSAFVEVWSSATMTQTRLIDTGQGSVSMARFVGDSGDLLTSGHDGRLVRWTAGGQGTEIARRDQPIDQFAQLEAGGIVFSTSDGALWRTGAPGQVVALRPPGARVKRIVALADPSRIYAGDANGDVIEIDAASWRSETVMHASGAVHEMVAAPGGRMLALITNQGNVYVGARVPATSAAAKLVWTTWDAGAVELAIAPDGLIVASASDGMIWLYAPASKRWLCVPTGLNDLARVAVAPGGETAATFDIESRLIRIDLTAARQRLEGSRL